jgi:hypothetical protein
MFDIHKWKELSLKLKRIKEEEADLRREICQVVIADAEMKNGRVTVKDYYDGMEVKATQTLSYTIDVAVLGTVWEHLSPEEQDAIVMKPSLSLAKYKKLPEDSLLHEAVISKLAMPTLLAEEYGE